MCRDDTASAAVPAPAAFGQGTTQPLNTFQTGKTADISAAAAAFGQGTKQLPNALPTGGNRQQQVGDLATIMSAELAARCEGRLRRRAGAGNSTPRRQHRRMTWVEWKWEHSSLGSAGCAASFDPARPKQQYTSCTKTSMHEIISCTETSMHGGTKVRYGGAPGDLRKADIACCQLHPTVFVRPSAAAQPHPDAAALAHLSAAAQPHPSAAAQPHPSAAAQPHPAAAALAHPAAATLAHPATATLAHPAAADSGNNAASGKRSCRAMPILGNAAAGQRSCREMPLPSNTAAKQRSCPATPTDSAALRLRRRRQGECATAAHAPGRPSHMPRSRHPPCTPRAAPPVAHARRCAPLPHDIRSKQVYAACAHCPFAFRCSPHIPLCPLPSLMHMPTAALPFPVICWQGPSHTIPLPFRIIDDMHGENEHRVAHPC
eukprot:355127-Chlamydomonas_euryale.AAC.26